MEAFTGLSRLVAAPEEPLHSGGYTLSNEVVERFGSMPPFLRNGILDALGTTELPAVYTTRNNFSYPPMVLMLHRLAEVEAFLAAWDAVHWRGYQLWHPIVQELANGSRDTNFGFGFGGKVIRCEDVSQFEGQTFTSVNGMYDRYFQQFSASEAVFL